MMRLLTLVLALLAGAAVTAGVPESPEAVRPLLVGAEVPAVTLTAADGSEFDLRAATAEERAIVIFYRGGW